MIKRHLWVLSLEREVPPTCSCGWTLGPQLLVLSWKTIKFWAPTRRTRVTGVALKVLSTSCSGLSILLPDLPRCTQSCYIITHSCSQAFHIIVDRGRLLAETARQNTPFLPFDHSTWEVEAAGSGVWGQNCLQRACKASLEPRAWATGNLISKDKSSNSKNPSPS